MLKRSPKVSNVTGVQSNVTGVQGEERLLIFARFPEPGKSKTRLIPALGSHRAAEIYKAIAKSTLAVAKAFASERGCHIEIHFTGGDGKLMAEEFGDAFVYVEQRGDCLGSRLAAATERSFSSGARRVLVIGTDCISLDSQCLHEALNRLKNCDVVLGPATDGGYYLIGLRNQNSRLFQGIDWGSEQVLRQTKAVAKDLRLQTVYLSVLDDIDHPEDLVTCRNSFRAINKLLPQAVPSRLSVIVPVINEEIHIEATLHSIGQPSEDLEIILADGGSTDRTIEVASAFGCRILSCNRGRARQMNAASVVATGEVLLFLHGDTRLPVNYRNDVSRCLDSGRVAGAFRLKIAGNNLGLRMVEWGANLRSRWLQLPYGDQGIFMRSDDFFKLGGYRHLPIMEDFELCRRIRRSGKMQLLDSTIETSSRRWLTRGIVKTTLLNQICILGFLAGIAPKRIATIYGVAKGKPRPPHRWSCR